MVILQDAAARAITYYTDHGLLQKATELEAAELLIKLERGYQAALKTAREASGTPAYRARREMSIELDRLSIDAMWESFMLRIRRPAESLEQFMERAQTKSGEPN